jgi:hypothetical protein
MGGQRDMTMSEEIKKSGSRAVVLLVAIVTVLERHYQAGRLLP